MEILSLTFWLLENAYLFFKNGSTDVAGLEVSDYVDPNF